MIWTSAVVGFSASGRSRRAGGAGWQRDDKILRNALAHSRSRGAGEDSLSTETEVEIALPFLTPDVQLQLQADARELERLTRDIVERTRAALPALAGGRETGSERPGSGHSGRRPDAHATGAAARGRMVWLRGVRGDARRVPAGHGISPAQRAAAEHVAESRRSRGARRGDPGGDSFGRFQERAAARCDAAVARASRRSAD